MSKYKEVLKYINIYELIIDNYALIGLTEEELVVVLKLEKIYNCDKTYVLDNIIANTNFTKRRLQNILSNLIDRGYIEEELITIEGKFASQYSIAKTFEKIFLKLEEKIEVKEQVSANYNISDVVKTIESKFGRSINQNESQMIAKWITEDKFNYEEITYAINKAAMSNSLSIKYIDSLLVRKSETYDLRNDNVKVNDKHLNDFIKHINKVGK